MDKRVKSNKIIPAFLPRPYNPEEAIRILNTAQASFYWYNGVQPVDIYSSKNYNTGKPCIVYVFLRADQMEVYDMWVKAGEGEKHEV